jgi:hypothetical protein
MRTTSAHITARSWLFTALALLAMAAQLGVALAPLAEGRPGRSMSSHIEAPGAHGHYTHDEATCASCQARSIQGTTSRPALPLLADVHVPAQRTGSFERVVSRGLNLHAHPRAPPSVI